MLPRRSTSGTCLAERVQEKVSCGAKPVVIALARGGVPVARDVARTLHAPLDVVVVRRLGVPGNEHLAMGAVGPDGVRILDQKIIDSLFITPAQIERISRRERQAVARRMAVYARERPHLELAGRTVVLVDEDLALGMVMRAAIAWLRRQGPKSIIIATRVARPGMLAALRSEVDDAVACIAPGVIEPEAQPDERRVVSDREVCAMLKEARWRTTSLARWAKWSGMPRALLRCMG